MSFRKITVKSGNEEITMDVTEEEYQRYYRPWWRMKKKEQRNREAMEQNGYTEESYEGWKDGLTEGQEDEGPQVEGADASLKKGSCWKSWGKRWMRSFRRKGSWLSG